MTGGNMPVRIVGVHRIEASEPVHLIEIDLDGTDADFDWDKVTQASPVLDRASWQAAYEERRIGSGSWVFFFHCLDLDRPLTTSAGELTIPPETPVPPYLRLIAYEPP